MGTAASFHLGKLCSSTFHQHGLGGADPTFSLLDWPCISSLPGRSTGFLQPWGLAGDGQVPLAGPIRTNLWFCRKYWECGAKLVECVRSFQGLCCCLGKRLSGYEADTEDRNTEREVDTDSWRHPLSSWIHLKLDKAWFYEPI